MKTARLQSSGTNWVEIAFSGILIVAFIRVVIFVIENGYLPQPFFYNSSDTFADWFNPSSWAHTYGAFDVFGSLYPPLSFVFLNIFSLRSCYAHGSIAANDAGDARSCDWVGIYAIILFYILNVFLVFICLYKTDRRTVLFRTIGIALGFPLLNAVERGNLTLVTFTCVILAFGRIVKSSMMRSAFAALAVNFKIYLILAILSLTIKRKWRWVEITLIFSVFVYAITFAFFGSGSPVQLLDNIFNYSGGVPSSPLDFWMAGSYNMMLSYLRHGDPLVVFALGSRLRDALLIVLPLAMTAGKVSIVVAIFAAALRPEVIPSFRLVNLGILIAEISSEAGGYTMALHTLFVFMEKWRGIGRKTAIVLCYIVAMPLEIPIQWVPPGVNYSFISDHNVIISYYVGLGFFLRPMTTILIGIALSMVTIREVWSDIRLQGWSERWRFRRDAPLLPWVRRPTPVALAGGRSEADR